MELYLLITIYSLCLAIVLAPLVLVYRKPFKEDYALLLIDEKFEGKEKNTVYTYYSKEGETVLFNEKDVSSKRKELLKKYKDIKVVDLRNLEIS